MNCEQATRLASRIVERRPVNAPAHRARRSGEQDLLTEQHLALEHIAACPDCRAVQLALAALAAERRSPTPGPPPGALHRAVDAATAAAVSASAAGRARRSGGRGGRSAPELGQRLGFWSGMGLGAAAAAGLAAAILAFMPPAWRAGEHDEQGERGISAAMTTVRASRATPEISMALNETRDVNISVEAPTALPDAEIRVVLTGAIELAGFEGQKELRWRTDLAAGPNQLRLPIVALGGVGGQLLVEVQHGARHRTFVVDVKATNAATSAQQPRA